MGLLGALFGKQRVQILLNNDTVLQFDASIREVHSRESPPTEFPVENGSTVSDHIIVKPFSLELTGIISDTPINDVSTLITEVATSLTSALVPPIGLVAGGAAVSLFKALSTSDSPSVAAYGTLLLLQLGIDPETGEQTGQQPLQVDTSLWSYKNMFIKSISAPRDADTGQVLLFTMVLQELIIVQAQTVNIGVYANPDLASAQADQGQQSLGPSAFQQGQLSAQSLVGGSTK